MHRSIRGARGRKLVIASILVSGLATAGPAVAEIYKCVTKAGLTMYQNFPCQYDSNPDGIAVARPVVNAAMQVTNGAQLANAAQPKPAVPVAVAANGANPPTAVKAVDPTEPSAGMMADEVKALLGEPLEIVQDDPSEGIETWRYINHNLQIDHTSRKVVEVASW